MYSAIEIMRNELNSRLLNGDSMQSVLTTSRELDQVIAWYTNIEKTCCFTGHFPQKYYESSALEEEKRMMLKDKINACFYDTLRDGYHRFLCCGRPGIEILAAKALIEMKEAGENIFLELVLPDQNGHKGCLKKESVELTNLLAYADAVSYLSQYPDAIFTSKSAYKIAAKRCKRCIAFFDDSEGSAGQMLKYAKKQGLEIIQITL